MDGMESGTSREYINNSRFFNLVVSRVRSQPIKLRHILSNERACLKYQFESVIKSGTVLMLTFLATPIH